MESVIRFDAHNGVSTTYMQSTDFGCKIEPHGFDKVINGSEAEVKCNSDFYSFIKTSNF